MGHIIRAVILLATFVLAGAAHAATDDGAIRVKTLVKQCNSDQKTCEEYLLGVWDAVIMMQEMNQNATAIVCPAEGPSGRQLRIAFNIWADQADPKVVAESPRVVGAILAYKRTYPCAAK